MDSHTSCRTNLRFKQKAFKSLPRWYKPTMVQEPCWPFQRATVFIINALLSKISTILRTEM